MTNADAVSEGAPRSARGTVSMRVAMLAVFALAIGVFAFTRIDAGRSSATAPTDRELSALAVVADDLVTTSKSEGQAVDAVGGYLPGTGIVLTVHLDEDDAPTMEQWVRRHLDSHAGELAILPEGESVVVTVDTTTSRQARVWSLTPAAIARADGSWDRLVAPATFAETRNDVVVSSGRTATSPTSATELPRAVDNDVAAAPAAALGEPCSGAFADSSLWSPASGSWTLKDCVYSQTDATGFGYSTAYLGETTSEYNVSVSMRAPTGDMNGGIIIGQPEPGRKHGARVIDITGEGTYLRWGEYDADTGEWVFIGGAPIEPALSPTGWTKLTIEVTSDSTRLQLNDRLVASIDPIAPNQFISLVSSVANLEFRDFALEQDRTPAPNTSSPVTSDVGTRFDDELADWALLSGSWVARDGVLQQRNGAVYDQMMHFSKGPRSRYRVEVDIRALPDSTFSGGLLFDVQEIGTRSNSYVFDIVDDGETIRWARYDHNGVYAYGGGRFNDPEFDADTWHTIAVEVGENGAEFFLDGSSVGQSSGTFTGGHVGLVTSLAAMEFRNFSIAALD